MVARPSWVEDIDDRAVELGLWVQEQLDEGRTLRQIAQSQHVREEVVSMDRAIEEKKPTWGMMFNEVTDMTGPECDYYWDDKAELPNRAGWDYIYRRVLESCRWWAGLSEAERATYRAHSPYGLPYEWWGIWGPNFVDTPEEGTDYVCH